MHYTVLLQHPNCSNDYITCYFSNTLFPLCSTLCKFLKKSGFTRQKMKVVAARQDQHLRDVFTVDVRLYDPSTVC